MSQLESLTTGQRLALCVETRAVVELSRRGIEELWRIDGGNDFVHLPLQLLAQGFERLLKLTYSLAWLKQHGTLPDHDVFIKRYGHSVIRLTDDLVELVDTEPEYVSRPAVQADLTFIRTDSDLRRCLTLLSTFGTWSRYYRFEEFLGTRNLSPADDPDRAWHSIELDALRARPHWIDPLSAEATAEAHWHVAGYVTRTLEKFARAIVRMWVLGALDEEARRHTATLGHFLFLDDDELGKLLARERRSV